MTSSFSISRRDLPVGAAAAGLLALAPSLALAAGPAKIPMADLLAPDALPDIWLGQADAPVTIIEYASMTCSHCAAFHEETYPKLLKDYIETGKVRFVLREFPLDPLATAASMLARAAGDKRPAMVSLLFAQQKNWAFVAKPLDALEQMVKQAGISTETFQKVLGDKELRQNVLTVRQRAAEKFGVDSTPTFFINGDRRNGEISVGDLDKVLAPYLDKK